MDALRQSVLNLGICQDHNFGEDRKRTLADPTKSIPTKFNIISIFALENGNVDIDPENIQQLSEEQLIERFPSGHIGNPVLPPLSQTEEWHQCLVDTQLLAPKPRGTTATLNVIYVDNEKDSVSGMLRDTLLKLFETFGLDRSILHFLSRGADTWHCIRRHDETCAFLLIIQSLYCMACSFSPRGRETNCVIFGSPPKEIENDLDKTNFNFYQPAWFCKQLPSNDRWADDQSLLDKQKTFEASHALPKLLENIQSHHLHHPLSLAYLGLVDSLSSIFIQVEKQVKPISELSHALKHFTKIDMANDSISDDERTLDSLVTLSEKAGRANVTMARLSKVTGVASMLIQTLQDSNGWKRWCRRFFLTSSGSQYDRAAEWLAEGLPSCRQILQNEKLQIQSQDDRVKALTPIIFALISRADAQSGLTIAVMTMTFLPATSIAAIMAVPWDRGGQGVRALQAIVYCVVTFFMTLAVFLIWMKGVTWFKRSAAWFKRDTARFARDARDATRLTREARDALGPLKVTRIGLRKIAVGATNV